MRGQSYIEITEQWTIEDVFDANAILNAIDGAHARVMREVEQQRESAGY